MIIGDLQAQAEATRVAEREILRLVEKYGKPTIMTAFGEVQDYVEILTRRRIAELPDGVWETEDYLDSDPTLEEGLIPIKVKMRSRATRSLRPLGLARGGRDVPQRRLRLRHVGRRSPGTKTFFPEVPLNSGSTARCRSISGRGHQL